MRRVVVVDRDPVIARSVARTLGGRFDVLCPMVDDALSMVEAIHFDVLLCDWHLPDRMAEALVEVARARPHRPRIWLTCAGSSDSAIAYAVAHGLTLLAKPIPPTALSAWVA